ncbi:hypothetical protein [Geodermatophilus sp. URMC 64]
METTATLAPVARPRFAAANFLPAGPGGRAVVAQAVSVAFAVRTDPAAAVAAHALDADVVAALLAR